MGGEVVYYNHKEQMDRPKAGKEQEMFEVYFDGITSEYSCYIQNARVIFDHEPCMNEIVTAIKENNYKAFKLQTMKRFVEI